MNGFQITPYRYTEASSFQRRNTWGKRTSEGPIRSILRCGMCKDLLSLPGHLRCSKNLPLAPIPSIRLIRRRWTRIRKDLPSLPSHPQCSRSLPLAPLPCIRLIWNRGTRMCKDLLLLPGHPRCSKNLPPLTGHPQGRHACG